MRIRVSPEEQLAELKSGTAEIISESELLDKLRASFAAQQPLVLKLGADPSRPDLHLGHMVVLRSLRLLQDFGHIVKFLIGDYTALIGDPTGRNKTRPQLSEDEIKENSKSYASQVFKVLDPEKTDLVYNSSWLKGLSSLDLLGLLGTRTVQQILARDDFNQRYQKQVPIYIHELCYPVLQAYDSYVLKADVEFGGIDQKFNLLLGREVQKFYGQASQSLVLCPLLEGTDGVQKMSKSFDNYIAVNDSPDQIFGKTMSLSDQHMLRFYRLLSKKSSAELAQLESDLGSRVHPMTAKKDLAEELVSMCWDRSAGFKAREQFEKLFSRREVDTSQLPRHEIISSDGSLDFLQVSVDIGFSKSRSEARRALEQGGMKLDGEKLEMAKQTLDLEREILFQQGKLKRAIIWLRKT